MCACLLSPTHPHAHLIHTHFHTYTHTLPVRTHSLSIDRAAAESQSAAAAVEDDSIEYTSRPGKKEGDAKDTKGSRLKTKVFRTHFRAKLPEGVKRKKTVFWTDAETAALRRGHFKHGNSWTAILTEERQHFNECRTSVDLKDKWRSLEKTRTKDKGAKGKAGRKSPSKKTKSAVMYEGDIKIRGWLQGNKDNMAKMTAPGHTTLTQVIEFCRSMEEPNFMEGIPDVTIKAGHDESSLQTVGTGEHVGNLVDPAHDANSKEKPYVYVELHNLKGRNV